MKPDDPLFKELEQSRESPPADFVDRVMAGLPDRVPRRWFGSVWPAGGQWLVPATAGAVAAILVLAGISRVVRRPAESAAITVTFELQAPDAEQVELAGTFNNWRTNEIVLTRPEGHGPWVVTMDLPAGRHEYLFLVDGERWITDPKALVCRPDGFGNCNAVLEI